MAKQELISPKNQSQSLYHLHQGEIIEETFQFSGIFRYAKKNIFYTHKIERQTYQNNCRLVTSFDFQVAKQLQMFEIFAK